MHETADGIASRNDRYIKKKLYGAEVHEIGKWQGGDGEQGGISVITNMRELDKYMDVSGKVIEDRYERGDEGINRYERDEEKAILSSFLRSMREDGRIGEGGHITRAMEVGAVQYNQEFWDNISGEWLHPDMVAEARKEERIEFTVRRPVRPIARAMSGSGLTRFRQADAGLCACALVTAPVCVQANWHPARGGKGERGN